MGARTDRWTWQGLQIPAQDRFQEDVGAKARLLGMKEEWHVTILKKLERGAEKRDGG